jgi:hypothetical protein
MEVVSSTPQPLYPCEKHPIYPLNRMLDVDHSRAGHFGKKISVVTAGDRNRIIDKTLHSIRYDCFNS